MSGSIYTCHSDTAGPEPRGRPTEMWVQDGWVHVTGSTGWPTREPVMRKVRTDWLPIKCGVQQQVGVAPDINCAGCANRIGGAE